MIHTVQNKPLHPLPTFVRLARCSKRKALKADGCWQQLLCLRPYQEYSFSLTSSRAKKRKNLSETASFIATCIQQRMKKGIIVPLRSPALSPAVKTTSSLCLNPFVPHITHKLTNTGWLIQHFASPHIFIVSLEQMRVLMGRPVSGISLGIRPILGWSGLS